jgi:ribonuclease BN (tRNA processing enzyme)
MGHPSASSTRLVLLGTAGGPWPARSRSGPALAVVVGERVYLVDCGTGVATRLGHSGLLPRLHQVFLTHLHSDHVCDFFNVFLLGWVALQERGVPVEAWGPGPAGGLRALPPDPPGQARFPLVCAENPTPGLADMTRAQLQAHAYDINVRIRETARADLSTLIEPHEIVVPDVGAEPPALVAPPMEPIAVTEDDAVRVTAILVQHPPVFPSFAYRFDTDDGSIVVSGDTTFSPNLVRLARGADILVHEVLDARFMTARAEAGSRPGAMLTHLLRSHTPLDQVGGVAEEAGVGKLVLTHFIPSLDGIPEQRWADGAAAGFGGEVVVGRDLLEVEL